MSFIESPIFPQELAFSAESGPRFSTSIATGLSGAEARSGQWSRDLAQYEFGILNRDEAETKALLAFFYAIAKGRANGFRFRDYNPGESRGTDEPLGVGDGTTRSFQLSKRYTIDSLTYDRVITKPIVGSTTVKVAGVGVAANRMTVNTTNGLVTLFDTPTVGQVVTASYQFDVPCRFSADWCAIRRIDRRVYSWEGIVLVEIHALSGLELQQGMQMDNPLIEHWEYTETAAATTVGETENF